MSKSSTQLTSAWGQVFHKKPAPETRHSWRRNVGSAVLFLTPALALLLVFRIFPILNVTWDSFRSSNGTWVGFDNFAFLFNSSLFWSSLEATLWFNLWVNPIQILLALVLALAIADGARPRGLFSSLNLLPVAVPVAVSAIVWGIAMRPDNGLLNALLSVFGIPGQPWLTSPDQALWAIIVIASWVGVGYWALFLLAGLYGIDDAVVEAAKLDGAGYFRTLFSVRLPMIKGPLLFVLVADTSVNLLLFAPVQMLTSGGPNDSTSLVMFDIYRNAFIFNDLPLAAAETVVLIIIVLTVVALQFRLLRNSGDKK